MPGEKTEKATPKKRRDARKEGDIFKSNEINNWLSLGAAIFAFSILWKSMLAEISSFLQTFLTDAHVSYEYFDLNVFSSILLSAFFVILRVCAPLLLTAAAAGLLANYLQVGFLFVPKSLKPKFERISPAKGLKRIFSVKVIKDLVKSLLKIAGISVIGYLGIKSLYGKIYVSLETDLLSSIEMSIRLASGILFNILIAMAFVSMTDYIFQYFEHEKKLKMSKQEIKDEYKTTEGNPEIKSRVREIQRTMANMRMMQQVPSSDVVITNPTHFAVALKYDSKKHSAPIVTAKGADLVAEKIKETAKKNKVAIVENKEVARELFKKADIGKQIPLELFNAVAEILAYIYKLNGRIDP
jgi:flagellar biosynthesis protein FlhB